ncbi:ABC transporter permease [Curtanaerobium respiraculi]|uniref:ABC transporter permease n=1 Tax=Curtanaerobium respiraculi TaxID=2949669 RepID=UPI0024B38145|nr:FtsX-like permease family protein [Curtanaerobium respiraculi]
MGSLLKRIPRQLRWNAGKYLGIFVLIAFAIAFIGGYLTATNSITTITGEMFSKYNVEHGRITVSHKLDDSQIAAAQDGEFSWIDRLMLSMADDNVDFDGYEPLQLYELFCRDAVAVVEDDPVASDHGITMRLYKNRTQIDLPSLREGRFPEAADEIAIDPTFAANHGLRVGDGIEVSGKELSITGLATLPDYTALFQRNTDFVMDDLTFCVGILTPEGYDSFADVPQVYTYGFRFQSADLELSDRIAAEKSLARVLVLGGATVTDLIDMKDNQGISFAIDDVEGDALMYRVFYYLIIVIMAFIFVVITNATIEEESSTIGTLLASGYRKGELLRHYLILPMIVAIAAAIVGNLGIQRVFVDWTRSMYYKSYSLPLFELHVNPADFAAVTIVPLIMLFAITSIGLARKMRCTPLAFLRHETGRARRGRGVSLPAAWPFKTRFRLRILLSNLGSVITIFLGIVISGTILLFGVGLLPLVDSIAGDMADSLPAGHVYTLKSQVELADQDSGVASQAEKVELVSLETEKKWGFGPMKVTVYGVEPNSLYWGDVNVPGEGVVLGAGLADKIGAHPGDTIMFDDPYEGESYKTRVESVYGTQADANVYANRAYLNTLVKNDADAFNGWASDAELHFDAKDVASVLTPAEMKKIADQLEVSMGDVAKMMIVAAILIFVVVIYLLSKTIMERSSRAASQLKVFGYRDSELSLLYVRSLTIAVVISLAVSVPVIWVLLDIVFQYALMSYDITFGLAVPFRVFVEYWALGLASYAVVALLNRIHLRRVPLALALKAQE